MEHESDGTIARSPEEVHAVIQAAFTNGDLDAYSAAYEADATLVAPPGGEIRRGRAAIRASTAALLARRPRMTSSVVKKVEGDGCALTVARWQLEGVDADGGPIALSGRATVVSRRRPDGTWGILIDDTMSPD